MPYAPSLLWRIQTGIQDVQELRSLLRDLIPELILSQKLHIHNSPTGNGSGVMSFYSTLNKLEREEEHCAFIEICCLMYLQIHRSTPKQIIRSVLHLLGCIF